MKTLLSSAGAICLLFQSAHAGWVSDAVKLNAGTIQAIAKHPSLKASASPTKSAAKKEAGATAIKENKTAAAPSATSSPVVESIADARLRACFEAALKIVTTFESGDVDKFTDVTPDFDTQGLSAGLFGWNVKQGSLQPLIRRVGKTVVLREMPRYGGQFWTACNSSTLEGLKIVRSWQDIIPGDAKLGQYRKATWKAEYREVLSELRHLLGSQEMRSIQMSAAMGKALYAWSLSCQWAEDSRGKGASPTVREFTTFLDTVVQNGDMAGLSYYDVRRWKKAHESYQPSALVCRWLARTRSPDFQPTDAMKNASLWASGFPRQYEQLLLLCWLRAQESYASDGHVQPNVLCRRGTILANKGWVNGRCWEFPQLIEQGMLAQR